MRVVLPAATVFLSALLLLAVQPLLGKRLLPWFGGSPGVWSACLLFFQAALFAGYALAHGLVARAAPRLQLGAIALLIALAATALPLGPGAADRPTAAGEHQALLVLALLGQHVGLPYLALACSAPLVQHWYERATGQPPYPLYAWSNAGSLLGLLSYPLLVEPALELERQAFLWSALFAGYAVLLLANCARAVFAAQPPPAGRHSGDDGAASATPDRPRAWFAFAVIPSVLLVAGTNYITVDVAPGPLLWVLPLALYLLSFVVAFGFPRLCARALLLPAWVASTALLGLALFAQGTAPLWQQLAAICAALFSASLLCHGELWRARPAPARLSRFYLVIAGGGACGGLLVSLVAPRVFAGFFELQLAVFAVYAALLWTGGAEPDGVARPAERRWLWLGIGVASTLIAATYYVDGRDRTRTGRVVEQRRNFFGVLRVTELRDATTLTHGRIRHGAQLRDPERRQQPTMYYGPHSGIGRALLGHAPGRPRRIGVIGLGVGTIAAYGRPGDRLRFYELDRDVAELARSRFSFLADSRAAVEIVLGDARVRLEAAPAAGFDLLVVDAFASDSVPAHLLTVEAFAVYLRHLRDDGLLVVNVANRHLDVERVVAGSAARHGLALRLLETARDDAQGLSRARWALLARDLTPLDALIPAEQAAALASPEVVWTDSFSDLLSVLR